LTPGEAITLFLTQVKLTDGQPFPVYVPNAKTKRVLREDRGAAKHYSEWAKIAGGPEHRSLRQTPSPEPCGSKSRRERPVPLRDAAVMRTCPASPLAEGQ
jgi:hypothetical protein